MTRVREAMSREIFSMSPRDMMVDAAGRMEVESVEMIPVCEAHKLVGVVTARDIVVLGVAAGCDGAVTPLTTVMSKESLFCYDDDHVIEALANMRKLRMRHIPVIDRDGTVVGIVSLEMLELPTSTESPGG